MPSSGRIMSYYSGGIDEEDTHNRKFKACDMIVYLRKLFVTRDQIRISRGVFSKWATQVAFAGVRSDSFQLGAQFLPIPPSLSEAKLRASLRYAPNDFLNLSSATSPPPSFYYETMSSGAKRKMMPDPRAGARLPFTELSHSNLKNSLA